MGGPKKSGCVTVFSGLALFLALFPAFSLLLDGGGPFSVFYYLNL